MITQRLAVVALGLLLALATRALASELPKAPDRYSWKKVAAIKGAFLVPDDWNFREIRDGTTLAIFITEKAFEPPNQYETGVSINSFLQNPSAPAQLKRTLDQVAAAHSVSLEPGSFGPFATLSCRYDSQRGGGAEPVRIFNLGIVNSITKTSYLVSVEAPVRKWPQAWRTMKPILDMLALDTEIHDGCARRPAAPPNQALQRTGSALPQGTWATIRSDEAFQPRQQVAAGR